MTPEQVERKREAGRRWREKNREKVAEYGRQWREANPQYAMRYYVDHRESMLAQTSEWQKRNPEKVKEYQRRKVERVKQDPVRSEAYRLRKKRTNAAASENLTDAVVANRLRMKKVDVPVELMEAKRAQLMLRRRVREIEGVRAD